MFEANGIRIRVVVSTMGVMMASLLPMYAQEMQTAAQPQGTISVPAETMERMQQHLAELETEVRELKSQMQEMRATTVTPGGGVAHTAADDSAQEAPLPSEVQKTQGNALLPAEDRSVLDYL